MSKFPDFTVDTDKGDVTFEGSLLQVIGRNCVVSESKLIQMVDDLGLWADIGGHLDDDLEV